MVKTDPRIDAYIEKSADFAQPVMIHLRKLIHTAAPDIEETIKWGMPSFIMQGIVCGFAAFKEHCTFGFWRQAELEEQQYFSEQKTAMGSFGRIPSRKDLPNDAVMKKLIKDAVQLNLTGSKKKKPAAKPKKDLVIPDVLLEALAKNEKAAETFNSFPPSCKRDYIEWINEAKTAPTRDKRLATTIEWLTMGRRRNWKYENC